MRLDGVSQEYCFIDLPFDRNCPYESAERIICELYPHAKGTMEITPFTEGITNVLLKCSFDSTHVLLRAYGNRTNILIDRDRELKNHLLLQEHDLAPTLIAKFQNGLLYPYQPGRALKPIEMPKYYIPIAHKLAEWHNLLPCGDKTELWDTLLRWITWLEKNGESQADSFRQQVCQLGDELQLANHVVNGHNDLLSGNIILLDDDATTTHESIKTKEAHAQVTFVDFEYSTAVPRGYDIANHFNEWGGFACEFWRMPDHQKRFEWIKAYLPPSSTDQDIRNVVVEVEAFWGVPHLYWGIWALIQARISQIDFDYATYSRRQFEEYYAWRKTGATVIPQPCS